MDLLIRYFIEKGSRSMEKNLYVGCDVSSKENTVCFMNQKGEVLGYKEYPNTLPGAQALEDMIISFMEKFSFTDAMVGTEATGFLDLHLVDYLASSEKLQHFNSSIYQLNPKLVSNFRRAYANKEKTDKTDSFVIADRLRFGRISEPYESHKTYQPLRRLTRYRFHLVETIAREKSYFLTHLYLKFSAFSMDNPFSSTFGTTSLAIITDFSPDEIAQTSIEELTEFIIKNGKNRFKEPEKVVEAVKRIARDSYRLNSSMSSSVNLILATSLNTIRALEKSLKEIDKAIEKQFKAFPNTLQSIDGIGPVYSAAIFSEIGDISTFHSEDALAKQAGLTWKRYQSGNFNAEETRMSKSGNKYLRYYLIQAANTLRVHNDEYKDFYYKKFKEVTKHQHKRALALTARKFVRLLFALLKKGQLYNPSFKQIN